jgi:hypothetical protein
MKSVIKKAASSKTMRVATTFTGAAACAVAFAPTAMADTHTAAVQAQPNHAERSTMPLGIGAGNCGQPNQSHWLHVQSAYGAVKCYGGRGILGVGQLSVSSFCGGNNSGYFYEDGFKIHRFQVGTYFYKPSEAPFTVSAVSISTWRGGDTCP